MTITFIPKTTTKEVEVEGYGKIFIRQYGAGEELQIQANLRELEDLQKRAEILLNEAKEKYGGDDSKLPEEFKEKFEKIQYKVGVLNEELNQILKSTLTSEKKGMAEKLFNELPMSEIRRMITATREEEDAKTE